MPQRVLGFRLRERLSQPRPVQASGGRQPSGQFGYLPAFDSVRTYVHRSPVFLRSFFTRSAATDTGTVSACRVVLLNGQPLSNTFVSFEPALDGTSSGNVMTQPGSFGITGEDGQYELNWSNGAGAVPGTHRVILVWRDPERIESGLETEPTQTPSPDDNSPLEEAPVFLLPESARDGSLRFAVPETGTDTADFAF